MLQSQYANVEANPLTLRILYNFFLFSLGLNTFYSFTIVKIQGKIEGRKCLIQITILKKMYNILSFNDTTDLCFTCSKANN